MRYSVKEQLDVTGRGHKINNDMPVHIIITGIVVPPSSELCSYESSYALLNSSLLHVSHLGFEFQIRTILKLLVEFSLTNL